MLKIFSNFPLNEKVSGFSRLSSLYGLVPNCSMLSKVLVLARRGGGVGQARRWRWQVLKWLGYSKLYLSGQGVESGKYL